MGAVQKFLNSLGVAGRIIGSLKVLVRIIGSFEGEEKAICQKANTIPNAVKIKDKIVANTP